MLGPIEIFEALMFLLVTPGLLIPLVDRGMREERSGGYGFLGYLSVAVLLAALILTLTLALELSSLGQRVFAFEDTLLFNRYSAYLGVLVSLGTLLVAVSSIPEVKGWSTAPSFYSLILLTLAGVLAMLFVSDMATLLSAWTLVAVASYVVVGLKKDDPRSLEGAAKYGLMGAASSSLMVLGIAVLVGLTGTSFLPAPLRISGFQRSLILVPLLVLVAPFGFKLGIFPFHAWLPDVYGGVHPLLVSYIAGVVKMAAIAGILRMVLPLVGSTGPQNWLHVLGLLAVLTMTYGNMVALVQKNVQRMMAYSSIAHAGYLLVGFAAVADPLSRVTGLQGVALHLTTYVLAKVGVFVGLAYLIRRGLGTTLEDMRGIGRRMPALSLGIAVLLLNLMGMPPLLGFWSKFTYLFLSVVDAAPWLTLIAILNSGISVGYYAQVLRYMFFKEGGGEAPAERASDPEVAVVVLTAILSVVLGLGLAQPIAEAFGP
ncbi:MAG: NADH-quinone oxidoreductase subunit N [Candidatus Korarchaeota archaeon]|nr:NADH-quinone oxidoreductase subunit N [Candidatus Korarchaeota archaeon]